MSRLSDFEDEFGEQVDERLSLKGRLRRGFSRPRQQGEYFACGHPRTEQNIYRRKRDNYEQCRFCRSASRARWKAKQHD